MIAAQLDGQLWDMMDDALDEIERRNTAIIHTAVYVRAVGGGVSCMAVPVPGIAKFKRPAQPTQDELDNPGWLAWMCAFGRGW